MSLKDHKLNEAVNIVYQAPNSETGLTDVTMSIYDETGVLDGVNFPDVVMTEVGTTGKYRGTITPDAEGDWEIHIAHTSKTLGKVVKSISVGSKNLKEVSDAVDANAAAIAVVDGVVDSLLTAVTGQASQLTNIENAVNSIDSPPMIG